MMLLDRERIVMQRQAVKVSQARSSDLARQVLEVSLRRLQRAVQPKHESVGPVKVLVHERGNEDVGAVVSVGLKSEIEAWEE